jgi:hypothetical protein
MKEAMSMRSSGHLLRRAGREFLRNLIWMAVVFGSPAVILAAVTDLYLVGVSSFVGASVTVLAALVTVGALWSGAPTDEPPLGDHDYPGSHPDGAGHWPVGGWDGGGGDGGGGGV